MRGKRREGILNFVKCEAVRDVPVAAFLLAISPDMTVV
jgi:hypothetical protein